MVSPQIESGLKLDFLLSPVMTYSDISTFLTTHFTSFDDHIDDSSLPVTLHHKTLHFRSFTSISQPMGVVSLWIDYGYHSCYTGQEKEDD